MKSNHFKLTALAMVLFFQTTMGHASVTMVDGTPFARTLDTPHERLYLKGAALLTYLLFIEAYAGALYLPEGSQGDRALADIPKHLVLEYRVSISAEDFTRATRAKIEESVDRETFERLLPKIEAMNRLYKDVKAGDRYALTYVPGMGTRLIHNGLSLGTVEGAEFARAMFGIWIGENPIDGEFRDRLLGKR